MNPNSFQVRKVLKGNNKKSKKSKSKVRSKHPTLKSIRGKLKTGKR